VARERALSATDARFESSRKRASSEADKTVKPAKESGRRTLFSRPSKIMTNFAGGGKDKGKDKFIAALDKDDGSSPISPTYFRPFASPSNLRPRLSQDETSRTFSIGNLSSTVSTPGEGSTHAMLPPPSMPPSTMTGGSITPSSSSGLRPQLFHRTRERKDSNPTSILSVSTVLSKQNSSESSLTHSPASPSLFPGMERVVSAMPKSVSTQDIRQVNAGHYAGDGTVMDDPWPLLRARGLGLFHGEGMRINIEELNKLVLFVLF
jgi:HbrB-like